MLEESACKDPYPVSGESRRFQDVPDFAAFDPADRISQVFGIVDHPNTWRRRPPPGLAFVGDAAVTADQLWGVGCGWAFQSAEWLADSVQDAFASDRDIDRAVRRYRSTLRSQIAGHFFIASDYSTGRTFNPVERLLFSASTRDQRVAAHLMAFVARATPARAFLAPSALARAARVNLARRLPGSPNGSDGSDRAVASAGTAQPGPGASLDD